MQRAKGERSRAVQEALLLPLAEAPAAGESVYPSCGDVVRQSLSSHGVSAAFRAMLDICVRSLQVPPLKAAADNPSSSSSGQPNSKGRPVDVHRIDVIYVDDSILYPGEESHGAEIARIVEEQGGTAAGLNLAVIKLESIFEVGDEAERLDTAEAVECRVGPAELRRLGRYRTDTKQTPAQQLLALFAAACPSHTPRSNQASARTQAEDLHYLLVQRLLRRTASDLGCSSLLLGESATRSSVRLMESLAKGGGHKWALDGAASYWVDDLMLLRPMKDALSKEVAFYVHQRQLQCLESKSQRGIVAASVLGSATAADGSGGGGIASFGSGSSQQGLGEKASIGRLTELFVASLEKGVASTVNTISRTGDKLVVKGLAETQDGIGMLEEDGTRKSSGIGQKGDRLMAAAAKEVPRWRSSGGSSGSLTLLPCPLCGLPAQTGASQWKAHLSIRGADRKNSDEAEIEPTKATSAAQSDWLPLHEMLCYSCLLILDQSATNTDDANGAGAAQSVFLPLFVLADAQQRIELEHRSSATGETMLARGVDDPSRASERSEGATNGDAHGNPEQSLVSAEATAPEAAETDKEDLEQSRHQRQHHVTRRVGAEEMKGRVGEYLLD